MPGQNTRQVKLVSKRAASVFAKVSQKIVLSSPSRQILGSIGLHVNLLGQLDDLTRLMTRARFLECLIEHPRTEPPSSALVFIDLDRFKPINDEYGHHYGDIVLAELARRLEPVMAFVSRHGGDEFVGIISFEADQDSLDLHDKISAVMGEITRLYYIFDDRPEEPISIQASVGVRLLGADVDPVQELVDADSAMYHVKRNGGYYHIFSVDTVKEARRYRVDSKEHLVLDLDNVDLRYQLIYNLGSFDVSMVEATIHLPGVSVEYFMSNIERRSPINRPLFLSTFAQACQAAASWPRNASGKEVTLSFNLPAELLDRRLANAIVEIITLAGLKGTRVQFELLERGKLSGNEEAKANLARLRKHGISFYIDDIGEKNANIEIIDEYEVHLDGFKVGTTFTLEMAINPVKRALVQSLLIMADKLSKNIIVEGIETVEDLRVVAPYMPPYVQGFLFHRPEANGAQLHEAIHTRSPIHDRVKPIVLHANGSCIDLTG